jgi:drug/metabolite transporter (DMT)-like permease
MISILLSVLSFNCIIILFRLFHKWNINNNQAIVANYFVSGTLGYLLAGTTPDTNEIIQAPWLPYAIVTGIMFIVLFNIMALCTQKAGLSITAVSNKMSFIIPVLLAVWLYNAPIDYIDIAGIFCAIAGVYLSVTVGGKISVPKKYIWLPLSLFFGGGLLDALLNYTDNHFNLAGMEYTYTAILFYISGIIGLTVLLIQLIAGKQKLHIKSILAGIILGFPNYGGIYFLMQAIADPDVSDTAVFPLNNLGVVIISALTGVFIFKEKLSTDNKIGLLLSVLSIVLIGFM